MFPLHVPVSHVYGNINFYYVHGVSYIVGMCASVISTTICRKYHLQGKSETSICINSIQYISYILIHGIFTVVGGYKCGVINNRPVITENKIIYQNKMIATTTILTFRLREEKFISALVPFN